VPPQNKSKNESEVLLVRRHFKIICSKESTKTNPKIISFDTTHPFKIISERLKTNHLVVVPLLLKTVPLPQHIF
jgi:hypothetical protein